MRRVAGWTVIVVALGVIAGLLWLWLSDPAEWEVTTQGIILTEDAARGQFQVVVWFVAIGAVLCLLWGFAAGRSLRDLGWVLVPVFAAGAALAAVVAWKVGVLLGPSDPRDAVAPSIGDRLPSQLDIDAVAPFLVWPMFALIGLLLSAWTDRSDDSLPGDRGEHSLGE